MILDQGIGVGHAQLDYFGFAWTWLSGLSPTAGIIGRWFDPILCHGNADRIAAYGNQDRIVTHGNQERIDA